MLWYSCVDQPCIAQLFVKTHILGHNVEVARNHQREEGSPVKLRDGLQAHSSSQRTFWLFDARTTGACFTACWPCRALSASCKREGAGLSCLCCIFLLLHSFTANQMLRCGRPSPISPSRDGFAFSLIISFL